MTRDDEDAHSSYLHIQQDGQGVIRVVGEIDMTNSTTAREQLSVLIVAADPVTLDLSALTYLGSHGVTTLVDVHNLALSRRASMVIVSGSTNRAVQRLSLIHI